MDPHHYQISTTATSIKVSWDKQLNTDRFNLTDVTQYDIKYRLEGGQWKCLQATNEEKPFEIKGLNASTQYEVKVFWCEHKSGKNNELFTELCKTMEPMQTMLMVNAFAVKTSNPFVYHLIPKHSAEFQIKVLTGNNAAHKKSKDGVFVVDRIRICDMITEYRPSIETSEEKTLLLLGATGTGKSTFVDALINYIADVSYYDNHRFALISKTTEEKDRVDKQSQSQTSSVTVYRIPKIDGSMIEWKVNIIDTPGFNDTRKNFDKRITEQIRELFEKKISHLDAILIVVPLSTTRLTTGQEEVFSSISRMFGADVADNIFVAITWDDGGEPTCLNVLRDAKIPINAVFRFNNSTVFLKPPDDSQRSDDSKHSDDLKRPNDSKPISNLTPGSERMYAEFWDTRTTNFSDLFKKLERTPRITVESSVKVMRARMNLEIRLASLKDDITEQAHNLVKYEQDKLILEKIKSESPENKMKAIYKDEVLEMRAQHHSKTSLNCNSCKKTCHRNCWVPINMLKFTCEVMENMKCTVCKGGCALSDHSLDKSVYEQHYVTKYFSGQDALKRQGEREAAFVTFKKVLADTEQLIQVLRDTALEKNEFTLLDFIQDLVIREKKDQKPGFQMRVQILKEVEEHLLTDSIWKLSMKYFPTF